MPPLQSLFEIEPHSGSESLYGYLAKPDGMRRPVSGRDAVYAPKLSTGLSPQLQAALDPLLAARGIAQ